MRSKGDRTWHFFHPLTVREYLQSCRVQTDVPGDKSDSRHAPDLMFNNAEESSSENYVPSMDVSFLRIWRPCTFDRFRL